MSYTVVDTCDFTTDDVGSISIIKDDDHYAVYINSYTTYDYPEPDNLMIVHADTYDDVIAAVTKFVPDYDIDDLCVS